LYTWHAAQEACPKGWRLPNNQEWKSLLVHFGGYEIPMEAYSEGDPKLAFNNAVKTFNLTMAGARFPDDTYTGMGEAASFWTSEDFKENKEAGHNVTFSGQSQIALFNGTLLFDKKGGYACRCMQE